MARQRLGQHFLGDPGWRKRILATLPLAANETWIEIGPGHGELTQFLAGAGRRVIAIEADPILAEGLRASADAHPAQWPGVEIVSGDVLATDIGSLTAEPHRARLRKFALLHHFADPAPSLSLGRPNLFHSHRDPTGSGAARRCAAQTSATTAISPRCASSTPSRISRYEFRPARFARRQK